MERKKRSKGSVWELCYANKIFGTFGFEMRALGQKLVKFCTLLHTSTHTHTTAAKLVVRIVIKNPWVILLTSGMLFDIGTALHLVSYRHLAIRRWRHPRKLPRKDRIYNCNCDDMRNSFLIFVEKNKGQTQKAVAQR